MGYLEPTLRNRSELRQDDLDALLFGRALALRIANYFSLPQCETMSSLLENSQLRGNYLNAPKIGRVGQAFFECQTSAEAASRYALESVNWLRTLRAAHAPALTPIDRLRLELDESWLAGANLATNEQGKMFAGLGRLFEVGSEAEPHQDILRWDAPGSEFAQSIKGQLAANVYLKVPGSGGELTLWPFSYDQPDYERLRNPGSYGLNRSLLPTHSLQIKPQVGDLILFNANNVHAVEKITIGRRVTWSCFVGFQNHSRPLVLWS